MKLSSLLLGLPLILVPEVASAEILSVKATSANFREKPNEAAKIKFSADKFYPVEVIERKSGWAKVKDFEGDEAWVAERMLAKQSTIVVAVDRANIREKPQTNADVLFKVEKGEVFRIEERKDGWMKVVDAKGDGGWIRGDMTWGGEGEKIPEPKITPDVKVEKNDKTEPKGKGDGATKAKEHDDVKLPIPGADDLMDQATDLAGKVPTMSMMTEPETLQMLCRAYLDDPPKIVTKPSPEKQTKLDKPGKPKLEKAKPTEKKPAKPVDKKKK